MAKGQAGGKRADEVAYAAPRVPQRAAPEVAFPRPLTPRRCRFDAANFCVSGARRTFRKQFDRAAELENPLLARNRARGSLSRPLSSLDADELSDWLMRYSDLPDATSVRALLLAGCRTGPRHHRHRTARFPAALANPIRYRRISTRQATIFVRDPILDPDCLDRAQRGNWASALAADASARKYLTCLSPRSFAPRLRKHYLSETKMPMRCGRADLALNGAPAADQPSLGY